MIGILPSISDLMPHSDSERVEGLTYQYHKCLPISKKLEDAFRKLTLSRAEARWCRDNTNAIASIIDNIPLLCEVTFTWIYTHELKWYLGEQNQPNWIMLGDSQLSGPQLERLKILTALLLLRRRIENCTVSSSLENPAIKSYAVWIFL